MYSQTHSHQWLGSYNEDPHCLPLNTGLLVSLMLCLGRGEFRTVLLCMPRGEACKTQFVCHAVRHCGVFAVITNSTGTSDKTALLSSTMPLVGNITKLHPAHELLHHRHHLSEQLALSMFCVLRH